MSAPLQGPLFIIGAGAVARTLGRLFLEKSALKPALVMARRIEAAEDAASFMAFGDTSKVKATTDYEQLRHPSAVIMIATPDRSIAEIAGELAARRLVGPGSTVFHCSGALDSNLLSPCQALGAVVASLHPLASFADPLSLSQRFTGVYCATEGDLRALQLLEPAFVAAGARVLRLSAETKALYHAGAVLASGYLVAVLGAALAAEGAAGIELEAASEMLAPLIRISIDNMLRHGVKKAMTGPLTRGDDDVVRTQHQRLAASDPALGRCYAELTRYASTLIDRPDPLQAI